MKEENIQSPFSEEEIHALADHLKGIYDMAIAAYTPMVDDICRRKATQKEVDWLLTWMFDFVGYEPFLPLFKRVCRAYWQIYPETVAFYIMEYRIEYDPESLIGTEYEHLLREREAEWAALEKDD